MPRRSILSAAERDSLLAWPDTQDELIRLYTFSEPDLSLIRQRRGDANRLGVAVIKRVSRLTLRLRWVLLIPFLLRMFLLPGCRVSASAQIG
jgi:hypothetical protein